jgi:hypothetical protein
MVDVTLHGPSSRVQERRMRNFLPSHFFSDSLNIDQLQKYRSGCRPGYNPFANFNNAHVSLLPRRKGLKTNFTTTVISFTVTAVSLICKSITVLK